MAHKKVTQGQFAGLYLPMIARGMSRKDIAVKMSISERTLDRYLHDPNYVGDLSIFEGKERDEIVDKNRVQIKKASERANALMDEAYVLQRKVLKELMNRYKISNKQKDLEIAARWSRQGLNLVRTMSEVNRADMLLQINVGDRIEVTHVNVIFTQIFGLVLPVLKKYDVSEGEVKQLARGVENLVHGVLNDIEQ